MPGFGNVVEGEIQISKKEKDQLLAWLNKRNDAGCKRLEDKIAKWTLIRNYVQGYNWADKSGQRVTAAARLLGTFSGDNNVDNEPYSNNVMMRIHMSNMQRLGRFMPDIEVDPNSSDLDDKKGARRTRVFLHDLLDKVKYKERLRRKIDRLICMYGSVYMKVTLDPTAGDELVKPVLDEFGKAIGFVDMDGNPGKVSVDVVAAKNIVLPPYVVDIADADWVMENNVRTTDYVLRRYGFTVASEAVDRDSLKWFRLDTDGTSREDSMAEAAVKDEDLCIVKEAWIRRCEEFPLGGHVIWCGREVLRATTLDDHYYDLPYFKAEFIYDDEDPDGDTPYWFMIPMQDALNNIEANIRRHCIMMTKPKWQQHTETILQDPDGITNETAQVLKWTGTVPPGIIQGADLPQTVFAWRDMVLGEMMSLGAAHDIIRPKQPRSGTAIAYEQEQDDTMLAPTIWSMGVMHEGALSFAARICSQYYDEPEQFSMRDPRGRMTHQYFSGKDLNGNFKVRVNMQSGLPSNKIARQQLIVQLKNQQIITAEDAKQFFEFGQESEAIRAAVASIERAEAIIENMEDGNPYAAMPAETFDNLEILRQQLQIAMQENWNGWDPIIKQEFRQAWDDVLSRLAPPMPMVPGPGGKPPLDPGAQPQAAPPGVPTSSQSPANQPERPVGGDQTDLYNIPGMEGGEAPAPQPVA